MVDPFTPNGGTDILAQNLAAKISEGLSQQVVVENRIGGNTLNDTVNYFAGELIKIRASINITHVPYKGSGNLMHDLK